MDSAVKPQLGRRERKALANRQRMLDAAEALFTRDGFAATTMNAIADEADMAVQTLYAVFGTKRAILTELVDARVVGDDRADALTEREDWQAMEREHDPHRQVELFASIATRIARRSAAINDVMAAAAGADPEIAALYERQRHDRYRDERRLARSLARKHALRRDLSEAQAADIIWAIATTRTYRALVHERGWTAEQYEPWLADVLVGALLIERSTEPTQREPGTIAN